ncbi:hypothetical protein OPT61_g10221 [Boeremia exigua]|uniref:Uncharacterized protein n=1 Tax=Boeremia exigua TaxID=749465 RepID=A0ACC2HQT2_9PLEO|nr:hypothetical protein OPT61_g10221 [Boeremia exigua]
MSKDLAALELLSAAPTGPTAVERRKRRPHWTALCARVRLPHACSTLIDAKAASGPIGPWLASCSSGRRVATLVTQQPFL